MPSCSKDMASFRSRRYFALVTFPPLNRVTGHSRHAWASFLQIFSLVRHFLLDLGPGRGQTDGQTTDMNVLCPTVWGQDIKVDNSHGGRDRGGGRGAMAPPIIWLGA